MQRHPPKVRLNKTEAISFMQYNTQRSKLIISEYGRNIQVMAELACKIEDREERNRAARTIIQLMAIMNPQVREEEDYQRKLWDHLHIISNFRLDVDSPYPMPDPEQKKPKPRKPDYPRRKMRYAHYGNLIERFINAGTELKNEEEREALTKVIANLMKRNYLNFNRDSVNDEMIKQQLEDLSGGVLKVPEDFKMATTGEILQLNKLNTQEGAVAANATAQAGTKKKKKKKKKK